jgi:hypothetical protein
VECKRNYFKAMEMPELCKDCDINDDVCLYPDKPKRERATELEYLIWFKQSADFGPASSDVKDQMKRDFIKETGKNIPEGWNYFSDGETLTDC